MSRSACRRPFRPAVEALEDRALLSVCTVDRLTDLDEGKAGRGDLRYCMIESLFRADTINFEVTGTINLTRALPTLTRSVAIEGPGATLMTVRRDLGNYYRVFTVAAGATVGISGLTILNGHGYNSPGGGIDNFGTLTVSNSTITGNFANLGGGGIYNTGTLTINSSSVSGNTTGGGNKDAGGVFNSGTLTVRDSTVSGNSTGGGTGRGGGIFNSGLLTVGNSTVSGNMTDSTSTSGGNGAGIFNSSNGTVALTNSTVSGNSAGADGGGGVFNSGILTVGNSTIAGNFAIRGGGIYVAGAMSVRNTIIAGNTAPAGPDVFGNLGSQGYNLLGNPQEASGWVATDLLHVNPRLGLLQDNGGPTWTRALLPGSPAADAGDPAFQPPPDTDQRGDGFRRVVGGRIDIGAFEVQPAVAYFFLYPFSGTVAAGTPFDMLVLVLDAGFSLIPDYTGEVAFWSTDSAATLPTPYTFQLNDRGIVAFFGGVTLRTPGVQVLLVFDTATFTIFGYAALEVVGAGPGGGSAPGGTGRPGNRDASAVLATPAAPLAPNATAGPVSRPATPRTLRVDSHLASMGWEVETPAIGREMSWTDPRAFDSDVLDRALVELLSVLGVQLAHRVG